MNTFLKFRARKWVLFGSLVLIAFNFLAVLINARYLRPSADDYCTGFIAQYGFIGAPMHMWSTWSGYFFTMFVENIVNGLPLLYLPWSISSALSFILSAVGMGITTFILLPKNQRSLRPVIFLVPLMAFLWWSYIWLPVIFLGASADLANGITHWQTLTSGYMLTTEILLSAWALLWKMTSKSFSPLMIGFLFFILGLLFGFTSEPINLAAIAVFGLYLVHWTLLGRGRPISRMQIYWVTFGIAILIGFAIAHLSPGNLARTALIKPDFSISFERMHYLFTWTFPYAIQRWLNSYIGLQGIIVFAIVFSMHTLSESKLPSVMESDYLIRGLQLSGFGILLLLVARFGEAFSYEGYWHFSSPLVLIVLSIYFLATYAGAVLKSQFPRFPKIITGIILIASLLMAIFSNLKMINSMQSRGILWSQGQAPLVGITDIETEWVNNCWINLQLLRNEKNGIVR